MSGGLWHLFWASALFAGAHVLLSSRPLRRPLIAGLGERPFLGLYSVVMIGALVWMIRAFGAAPKILLWEAPPAVKHLTMSFMLPALTLLSAGLLAPTPTLAPRGDCNGKVRYQPMP